MGRFYEDIRVLGGTATFGTLTASNTGNILEVDGNVGVYKVSSYLNLGLSPTFETQYESTSNTGIEIGSILTTRPNLSGDNTGFQIGGAGILYWDDTNDSTNLNGLMGMAGEIYVNSTSSIFSKYLSSSTICSTLLGYPSIITVGVGAFLIAPTIVSIAISIGTIKPFEI